MPRSSRHKSSKHSSREAREYSDSEKDSSLKDRKSKEDSGGVRVSKDSGSSDKRKLDSKEGKDSYGGSGNGDYSEDHSSSKRRKEKLDDRASDRWNGGDDDHRGSGEGSKKTSKVSSDSKSRRRDGSVGMYEEGEEVKKSISSGKGEGRHKDRDSSRKEGRESSGLEREREKEREREREREREKKGKEGRSDRLIGSDEHRVVKQVLENNDLSVQVELGSPEPDNQLERRMRKRRDGSVDVGKHQDDTGEISSKRLSSRDDSAKDGKQKDEKRKDERYKEKHREDLDRDKHREEKQRDERFSKDYPSSRSDDKHSRDEKDTTAEIQQKRSKVQDGERKGESDRDRDRNRDLDLVRDRDRDRDRDRHHDREHEHDRVRERDRDYDRGRDHDHDRDHDWDWDRERERDEDRDRDCEHDRGRNRDRDRERDREHDHDFDRDCSGSHLDDRAARYKDSSRGKRRSPDGHDDLNDSQSRAVKARYSDLEKKSLSGDRIEADVSKGRSHSRQAYVDTPVSSNKRRTSPSSSSHVGVDEYRHLNPEDSKYRDSITEQRSKAVPSRDISGFSGASERGAKYRSAEKPNKIDDGQIGELSNERSSNSKASPLGLVERSPSSSSIDRRYMNRPGVRRSLDIEETGRRSSASIDNRDFCANEDRLNRDLPLEKPLVDESSPADSSFYSRTSQANSALISPHHPFRAGVDSLSFIGSLEDDGRVNSNARYRRSSENVGRGHNNTWRGVPNWPSPVPNGFMPFQHGPPHGGFQGMMPQFPAPLFGVRPSMEINHAGMPYHIPDADRFSSHLRPLGWQNMMDGSGPSHLHAWDGNNGAFRDEHPMYGASEWDQNRHQMNGRGWESNADIWKGQNVDAKRDMSSPSHKDDHQVQASVDEECGQAGQMFNHEDNHDHGVHAKLAEVRSTVTSPGEDSKPKVIHERTLDPARSPSYDVSRLSRHYLSKLDISAELAHKELYEQCLSLLDIDQSTAVDEDTTDYIILEDGSGAGLKSSNTLLIASHFPPLKDSVFQRAMDLYKRQMMDTRGKAFVTGGTLDFISASNQENREEQVHCDVPRVKDPVPTPDAEMSDAPISNLDSRNVEAEAEAEDPSSGVAEEKSAERVSSPAEELHIHISPSPKLEGPNLDNNQDNQGEAEPISSGVKLEVISSEKQKQQQQQVESKEADVNGFSSVEIASLTVAATHSAVVDNLKGISNNTNGDFETEEEGGVAFGDAANGPLCIPDGSPKGCEALMSGSKESESIILSRIHHSPESTH